uniref:non-specific serine/threonine protein kinase n=1 Tax=Macrostomum lignano TaxID=282301 RepID=A0A1I8F6Z5_9PLAT
FQQIGQRWLTANFAASKQPNDERPPATAAYGCQLWRRRGPRAAAAPPPDKPLPNPPPPNCRRRQKKSRRRLSRRRRSRFGLSPTDKPSISSPRNFKHTMHVTFDHDRREFRACRSSGPPAQCPPTSPARSSSKTRRPSSRRCAFLDAKPAAGCSFSGLGHLRPRRRRRRRRHSRPSAASAAVAPAALPRATEWRRRRKPAGNSAAAAQRKTATDAEVLERAALVVSGGQPAGRFERLEQIGHGASGVVHAGRDLRTGSQVAIKQMLIAKQPKKELIVNEIVVMKETRHANILPGWRRALGGDGYLGGGSPHGRGDGDLHGRGPDWRRLPGGARALSTSCNENRVIQRDIKSDNVLLAGKRRQQAAAARWSDTTKYWMRRSWYTASKSYGATWTSGARIMAIEKCGRRAAYLNENRLCRALYLIAANGASVARDRHQ